MGLPNRLTVLSGMTTPLDTPSIRPKVFSNMPPVATALICLRPSAKEFDSARRDDKRQGGSVFQSGVAGAGAFREGPERFTGEFTSHRAGPNDAF